MPHFKLLTKVYHLCHLQAVYPSLLNLAVIIHNIDITAKQQ